MKSKLFFHLYKATKTPSNVLEFFLFIATLTLKNQKTVRMFEQ